jgi:magnesium chelatase family protein
MLIASMNPCPCGYYGSKDKECVCSEKSINKYMNKISGPLLDRIDIQIEVEPVKYQNLDSSEKGENSETIKKRVNRARKIQQERLAEYGLFSNAELTPKLIEKFCKLDQNGRKILKNSFEKLGLSARAYGRILKVARTIADLDEKENIQVNHLAEAIQYRNLDRKYWKN